MRGSIIGIKDELGLSDTAFGLLLGTPILSGSPVRVVAGIWADQTGARRVMAAVMVLGAVAIFLNSYADNYAEMMLASSRYEQNSEDRTFAGSRERAA